MLSYMLRRRHSVLPGSSSQSGGVRLDTLGPAPEKKVLRISNEAILTVRDLQLPAHVGKLKIITEGNKAEGITLLQIQRLSHLLGENRQVTELSLSSCRFQAEAINWIASLVNLNTQLQVVKIPADCIEEARLDLMLESLQYHRSLREFHVVGFKNDMLPDKKDRLFHCTKNDAIEFNTLRELVESNPRITALYMPQVRLFVKPADEQHFRKLVDLYKNSPKEQMLAKITLTGLDNEEFVLSKDNIPTEDAMAAIVSKTKEILGSIRSRRVAQPR